MTPPLRVGVIGLGDRWQKRYKPALGALKARFDIRALGDQGHQCAETEAAQLGCAALAGIGALIDNDDVEAVLLLEPQWYGLWPVEQLCRRGKPVYCGYSLEYDADHAHGLLQQAQVNKARIMIEMLPRSAPITSHLRELLAQWPQPPRLVFCDYVHPAFAPSTAVQASSPVLPALLGGMGVALMDWCLGLMAGEPLRVLGCGSSSADYAAVFLEYEDGRAVRVARHRAAGARIALCLEATGAAGTVWARWPRRLRWTEPGADRSLRLAPSPPLEQRCLEQFGDAVQQGAPFEPGLETAYRALRLLRAAVKSLKEGRWVEVTPEVRAD